MHQAKFNINSLQDRLICALGISCRSHPAATFRHKIQTKQKLIELNSKITMVSYIPAVVALLALCHSAAAGRHLHAAAADASCGASGSPCGASLSSSCHPSGLGYCQPGFFCGWTFSDTDKKTVCMPVPKDCGKPDQSCCPGNAATAITDPDKTPKPTCSSGGYCFFTPTPDASGWSAPPFASPAGPLLGESAVGITPLPFIDTFKVQDSSLQVVGLVASFRKTFAEAMGKPAPLLICMSASQPRKLGHLPCSSTNLRACLTAPTPTPHPWPPPPPSPTLQVRAAQ
jgi:hypothetical protein